MNALDIEILKKLLLEVRDTSNPHAAIVGGPTVWWGISHDLYKRIYQACKVFNL